jgi:hypothetical protein
MYQYDLGVQAMETTNGKMKTKMVPINKTGYLGTRDNYLILMDFFLVFFYALLFILL